MARYLTAVSVTLAFLVLCVQLYRDSQLLLPFSPTTLSPPPPLVHSGNLTLIMQNSGEMANNLCHFAAMRAIQLLAWEEYGLSTALLVQAQNSPKWKRAAEPLQQCFPQLRDVNFRAGNIPEVAERRAEQLEWLGKERADRLYLRPMNIQQVRQGLQLAKELQNQHHSTAANATISMPFLMSNGMLCMGELLERYFTEIQDLFRFDYPNPQCCQLLPDPDETVFHFRNFVAEIGQNAQRKGFEELSPHDVAFQLLAHLQKGDKVALVSRFPAPEHLQALQDRGLVVRTVIQSGVQDFCFLLHAQKELIGTELSTFTSWAAFLNQHRAPTMLYIADSPGNRRRYGDLMDEIEKRTWPEGDPRQNIRYKVIPVSA